MGGARRSRAMPCEGLPDHYAALGLPRSADDAAVRAAYRRQALLAHPDKGGAEEAFHAVYAAFKTLSNSRERAAYDAQLSEVGGRDRRRARTASGAAGRPRPGEEAGTPLQSGDVLARALEQLESIVAATPREKRRDLLASLPGRVSQALLAHMQARHAAASASAPEGVDQMPTVVTPVREGMDRPAGAEAAGAEEPEEEGAGSASSCEMEPEVCKEEEVALVLAEGPGAAGVRKGRPRSGGGCQGISKVGSRANVYRASVFCLNLVISSRNVDSLEQAVQFHTALELVRNRLEQLRCDPAEVSDNALAKDFDAAIEGACANVGTRPADLGLRFRPLVSALAEVGRQLRGRATGDVRTALGERRRMLEAKQGGWPKLRAAWVEVLVASGASAQEAEAEVEAAWRSHARRKAEAEARKLRQQGRQAGRRPRALLREEAPEERRARELAAAARAAERALASAAATIAAGADAGAASRGDCRRCQQRGG
uniref:J domain-containing protein n=1 Tax=Alexandrium monilatum TaxID=311494 RepID=A0A7S4ST05_9DINO